MNNQILSKPKNYQIHPFLIKEDNLIFLIISRKLLDLQPDLILKIAEIVIIAQDWRTIVIIFHL
jgi:hypothetical protein